MLEPYGVGVGADGVAIGSITPAHATPLPSPTGQGPSGMMGSAEAERARHAQELFTVLNVFFRALYDVQEKLIFRTQVFVRDSIDCASGSKTILYSGADLDYPAALLSAEGVDNAADRAAASRALAFVSRMKLFPAVEKTLTVLSKVFRVLELATFQGLAQEAVVACVASLRWHASAERMKSVSSTQKGAACGSEDRHLFQVRNLLTLREQVSSFECDLVSREKVLDFSSVLLDVKSLGSLLGAGGRDYASRCRRGLRAARSTRSQCEWERHSRGRRPASARPDRRRARRCAAGAGRADAEAARCAVRREEGHGRRSQRRLRGLHPGRARAAGAAFVELCGARVMTAEPGGDAEQLRGTGGGPGQRFFEGSECATG